MDHRIKPLKEEHFVILYYHHFGSAFVFRCVLLYLPSGFSQKRAADGKENTGKGNCLEGKASARGSRECTCQ